MCMNENICRPKCITSERIGNVEQKAADKCVHEYKYRKDSSVAQVSRMPISKIAFHFGNGLFFAESNSFSYLLWYNNFIDVLVYDLKIK